MLDQKQKTQPLFSAEGENRADKVFRENRKYATIFFGDPYLIESKKIVKEKE